MKRIFSLLIPILLFTQVFAYDFDVILTKERKQFQCFILSESENKIVYMLNDNDAKQYTMNKSDILKIYYAEREQKPESVATANDVVATIQTSETETPAASKHAIPIASNPIVEKDIIVLKNNTKIECHIQEVSKSEIKYKKLTNTNGPLFVEETNDILTIIFRDGTVQSYNQQSASATTSSVTTQEKTSSSETTVYTYPAQPTMAFQCNIEVGGEFTHNDFYTNGYYYDFPSGGVDLDAIFGVRASKLAFLGAGLGVHSEFANTDVKVSGYSFPCHLAIWTMPLYVNSRVYLPTKVDVNPFVEASLGGYIGLSSKSEITISGHKYSINNTVKGGFYLQLGLGLEIKRFMIGSGYRMLTTSDGLGHYGYVKLGVRVGKNVAPYKK